MLSAVLAAQFLDFDLGSALDYAWEDGLHLVLGADHFGCLRVVAAQVDGVKLALGRTHTAANAAIAVVLGLEALKKQMQKATVN